MGILIDLTGKRFGRLLVIKRVPKPNNTIRRESWWLCRCDCGNNKTAKSDCLKSGKVSSCGCLVIEHLKEIGRRRIAHKSGAFWILLRRYKQHAREHNRNFDLTEEQFKQLTSGNCHYCGKPPRKIVVGKLSSSTYEYNGIDRKDNEKGYSPENCVTCCYICNKAKHTVSYENYQRWLDDLVEYRSKCTK